MDLLEVLNWRYATKRMVKTKVSTEKINEITEAIRLSASSAGIQPYRLLVVGNEEIKKKLQTASSNPQISECSHLLVFAVYENLTKTHIDEHFNLVAKVRNVTLESLSAFKERMEAYLLSASNEDNLKWMTKQAYIGLGTGLIAAGNLQVDSTPMEGFTASEFDEILGLKEKGLKSVVLLALGYRDETIDHLAKMKKVRVPIEQFVIEML